MAGRAGVGGKAALVVEVEVVAVVEVEEERAFSTASPVRSRSSSASLAFSPVSFSIVRDRSWERSGGARAGCVCLTYCE